MTMLKVHTVGDSLGVILPKDLLSRLNIQNGDHLYVTESPDGALRITAHEPAIEDQMRLAREGMAQYRNALRELAK